MVRTVLMLVLLTPMIALAQVASGEVDPTGTAQALWQFIVTKNYWAALIPALILIVWAIRTYGGRFLGPKVQRFLDNPIVAWLLPVVVAALGAVLTSLLAGQPMYPDALMAGLKAGVAAVWAYVGYKKVVEAQEAAKAKAVVAVATNAQALDVHRRGPNP